jgi:predicted lipoprotein with Yx(FWY)xxD motif
MRNRWLAAPLLGAGAALIVACGSTSTPPANSSTNSPPASQANGANASTVTIMTASTSKGTVLTNAQGKTLYWFAIDTPTASKCTGSCLSYWPPVIGKPVAASGTSLPKGLGTITRSNGQIQATYDGHPLYTYAGDTAADQVTGNGLNESGGLWWAMTPSGAELGSSTSTPSGSATTSPASSGGGSGGYGY